MGATLFIACEDGRHRDCPVVDPPECCECDCECHDEEDQ